MERNTTQRENISRREGRWLMHERRGSYIVEAALVVPLFIAATVLLIWIVPVMASWENVMYSAADEMRLEMVKTKFRKSGAALPAAVMVRARQNAPELTFLTVRPGPYLQRAGGMEDLVTIRLEAVFHPKSVLGGLVPVRFQETLTGRAFTGTTGRGGSPRSDFEEDEPRVYVFPESGRKMHRAGCRYLRSACRMTWLSQSVRKQYHPCPNCGASGAALGTPVFIFQGYGEAYHLGGCHSVSKYYVEMSRSEAEEKGYSDCSLCGGGGK